MLIYNNLNYTLTCNLWIWKIKSFWNCETFTQIQFSVDKILILYEEIPTQCAYAASQHISSGFPMLCVHSSRVQSGFEDSQPLARKAIKKKTVAFSRVR